MTIRRVVKEYLSGGYFWETTRQGELDGPMPGDLKREGSKGWFRYERGVVVGDVRLINGVRYYASNISFPRSFWRAPRVEWWPENPFAK